MDSIRILEDYNLGNAISEYIDTGIFPTKYVWKRLVRDTLEFGADIFTDMGTYSLLARFNSTQSEAKLCYFWVLSRKFPHI